MQLKCVSINYSERMVTRDDGSTLCPAASVVFAEDDPNTDLESVRVNFTNITSPLPYFPGQTYEVTFTRVTSE